ncbi:MAG: hypothetical protein V1773_12810 [bacterium]
MDSKNFQKEIEKELIETIVCPQCFTPIDFVWLCTIQSIKLNSYIYLCPNCNNLLDVSEQKGFKKESKNFQNKKKQSKD